MAETTPATDTSEQWGEKRPVTIDATGVLQTPHGDVKPNVGKSIPDVEAIGAESEPLASWQKRRDIDPSEQIKIVKISHMRYQHPDMPTITKFLGDFGMHVVKKSDDGQKMWFGGYGPDQYVYYAQAGAEKKFLGGTFEVEAMADLEKATTVAGASQIEEMRDAPGGGRMVTLHDPEGFPINLMSVSYTHLTLPTIYSV